MTSIAACLYSASVALAEAGRRSGIDRRALGRRGQPERSHVSPVRPDEPLDVARDRQAVLRDVLAERQRLPPVWIPQARPGIGDHERVVDRPVRRVDVALLLERPVLHAVGDRGRGDAVPERRRRVAVGARVVDPVAEGLHGVNQLVERLLQPGGPRVPLQEQPVGREADRGLARRLDVGGRVLLVHEVPVGGGVVGGPRVPHRGGEMEQIPGVDRRSGKIPADRVERGLVPDSRHRPSVQVSSVAAIHQVRGRAGAAHQGRGDQGERERGRGDAAGHAGDSTTRIWLGGGSGTWVTFPSGHRTVRSVTVLSPRPNSHRGSSEDR